MRKPKFDMSVFKKRRQELAPLLKGSALLLCAHPHYIRNNDNHHEYRQDSNMFYLTGFEEPESIFLFRPGCDPEVVMFVLDKDPLMETWDGFRYGTDGVKEHFGANAAYTIDQFEKVAPGLLNDFNKIYYKMFFDHDLDEKIKKVLLTVKSNRGRSGQGLLSIEDPQTVLGEMRIKKSQYEIDCLQMAANASAKAHIEVMKNIKPGVNENTLRGVFIGRMIQEGCQRESYGGIFASGDSATTLHYRFNDQTCEDGDLFLIDAGGEYDYYAADITRTYPVNGKFTEVQKRIYQRVLDIQKTLIDMVKPGVTLGDLQKYAISQLTEIMIDEKALKGTKDKLIADKEYAKYYPHGVGHWLGMDVHDAGLSKIRGEYRPLQPGMCFTIEPGIYFPAHDKNLPEHIRGLGVRIEDNVVVTEDGCKVLTAGVPKEIDDLEATVGKG